MVVTLLLKYFTLLSSTVFVITGSKETAILLSTDDVEKIAVINTVCAVLPEILSEVIPIMMKEALPGIINDVKIKKRKKRWQN